MVRMSEVEAGAWRREEKSLWGLLSWTEAAFGAAVLDAVTAQVSLRHPLRSTTKRA